MIPIKNYRYREFRLWEYLLDMFLQPFMYGTGSKDAHWWDWEPYTPDPEQLKEVKMLIVGNGPAKRKFPHVPIFGRYNPEQLKSLYITLVVLPNTNILKPKDYQGEWSLLSFKEHVYGQPKSFCLARFVTTGAVKNLSDGENGYLGLTRDNRLIELECIETSSRHNHRDLLFV